MRVGIDFRPALFSPAGIGRYVAELVTAGIGRRPGTELILYGDAWRRELDPEGVARMVRSSGAKLVRRRIPGRLQRLFGGIGIGVDRRIGPVDLFHFTDCVFPTVGRDLKTVVTVHDLAFEHETRYHEPRFRRDVKRRVRAAVRRARRVLVPSRATRDDLIERLDYPPERVVVTPLGREHVTRPIGRAPALELDLLMERNGIVPPFILCVGTVEPRKNHARLLRAFSRLRRARPHQLVLVGRFGWMCDDVRSSIEELSREGGVRHLPGLSDRYLPGLYERAQFAVYLSHFEGFGLPVLESMACGAPTLTTRRGALPEVGGDAVRYCDPEDDEAIESGMIRLADDEALRSELARRGRIRAKRFSWGQTAAATAEVYREVATE